MRIRKLPERIRQLPFEQRWAALQEIVDAELHRHGICPISVYTAGPKVHTVGVYRDKSGWYLSCIEMLDKEYEYDYDRMGSHEKMAMEAIEREMERRWS